MVLPARPKLLTKTTRAERAKQRKGIVLADAAISARTQERYFLAVRCLLPIVQMTANLSTLDQDVCDWIEAQWSTGTTLSFVSDALCGIHHFEPFTKRQLPNSWKLFKTWRKVESPNRAPPLTPYILYGIANYAIDHSDLVFAGLLLLGFFAMLRTGELLTVKTSDLILHDSRGLLSLPITKTGQRHGASEMVTFEDPLTIDCLREVVALRQSQKLTKVPIWLYSAQSFRNRFAFHMKKFDLLQHCFRCYSLRRGGATALFQSCGSMETVLLKGRWNSPQVGKIYIQDGLSFLPGLTFSTKARDMLAFWNPYAT